MVDITNEQVKQIYELAKKVYEKKLTLEKATSKSSMTKSSAKGYIRNFLRMIRGERYHRTLNQNATEYFLKNIHEDYGDETLEKAISSVKQHIFYYENLEKGGSRHPSLEKICEKYKKILHEKGYKFLKEDDENENTFPEELPENKEYIEGAVKKITVNSYERNSKARKDCIDKHGYKCSVCDFDFEKVYGELGKEFIHVHHIIPISKIKEEYEINPIEDLRPVCPNCHAMLHRKKDKNCEIEELKKIIQE